MTNSTPMALKLPSEETSSSREAGEVKFCKTKTKAAREKARREKMNERYATLAGMLDAEEPKADKASILADTIREMKSLKDENDQLKQIIKFLEEKVKMYEKEQNLALYQHSLMFSTKPPPLPPPAQFPDPLEALFPPNQVFSFETQPVMGTLLGTGEERQDSSNGNQDLNPPWLTNIEPSTFAQDDFLHPPAA